MKTEREEEYANKKGERGIWKRGGMRRRAMTGREGNSVEGRGGERKR